MPPQKRKFLLEHYLITVGRSISILNAGKWASFWL
jgi:hypothetical protein